MSIFCKIIGHKPDQYASQGQISKPYHDGCGRSHRYIRAKCYRCGELFNVGSVIDEETSIDTRATDAAPVEQKPDNLKSEIADALDCFWNPAVVAIRDASYHGPATGSDVVGAIAQGLAAIAERLRS